MKYFLLASILIANFLVTTPANAQNTFKCGNEYSEKPCPGATTVPTADARSAAQKAQADKATQRDARIADGMEKDRLKAEAAASKGGYALPAAAAAPTPIASAPTRSSAKKKKRKEPEYFTAAAAGEGKTKKAKKASAKKESKQSAK